MSRIPRLVPDDLDGPARSLYEGIAHGRRTQGPELFRIVGNDGALEGPFGALLLNPEIGGRLSALGEGIRYHGSLPANIRELLILCVARDRRCEYEWYAHSAVARKLGIDESLLDQLGAGARPSALSAELTTAMDLYDCLRSWRPLPDDLYEAAVEAFGAAGIMEMVCLVFYYETLAALVATFGTDLPAGVAPQFGTASSEDRL